MKAIHPVFTRNLVALSAVCWLGGCSFKHPISSMASNLQVSTTNLTVLRLKARYDGSFLIVGKTKIERPSDNLLLIQVYTKHPFFRIKESDEINVEVTFDDRVEAVAFGDPDRIIWRRNGKGENPSLSKPQ